MISWFITHLYYRKSLANQVTETQQEINQLVEAIKEPNQAEQALLTQRYIGAAVEEWKKKGTPVKYLDSLEISQEDKAKLFRRACLRHKGREPKKNPYEAN